MSAGHVVAAVIAAAVLAGAVWRRRQMSRERLVVAVLVALGLAIYASGLLSKLPDPKKVIGDVAQALGPWTYALVGVFAYLETAAFVGLVAPGETIVIAGGVIAGQGEIDLVPLIGLVWACAILGDSTSFFIGRRLGRSFLLRHGPKVKITEERLAQVEGYFRRHGGKTILIGRFIGLVRALAPFVAGSSGLEYRRFLPFSVVGTGLWATTFCVLGYVFWQSFDRVAHIAGQAVFAFGLIVGVIVVLVWGYRKLRQPEERQRLQRWIARQEERPFTRPVFAVARPLWRGVLRPAVRVIAPQVRFLWNRLTPGALGLELTTLLAIGGAGVYVFVLYALTVSAHPGPTALDERVMDLADRLRDAAAVDAVKVVTALGALPTTAALVFGAVLVLAWRGRVGEPLALVVGFVGIYVAVQLTKAGIDRPRPADPLVHTVGAAYPSGHAAYSTAWVAVAVAVTRRLRLASHAALILAGLVVAAGVGLSRIYLRAHYWSDVAGGWGLGAGIFAACGLIAVVVAYIRHNARRREVGVHSET